MPKFNVTVAYVQPTYLVIEAPSKEEAMDSAEYIVENGENSIEDDPEFADIKCESYALDEMPENVHVTDCHQID